MNNDYFFLDNLYHLLAQGYGIEETLTICRQITHHPAADRILKHVSEGMSLSEAIKDDHLPAEFLEYYQFFSSRLTLSEAIKNSLRICQDLRETKHKLISQLTYPLILIAFLIIFSFFVTFILFPKVNELFSSFSVDRSIFFEAIMILLKIFPVLIIGLFIVIISISAYFIYALRHKKYMIIEKFLAVPVLKGPIQKYFTLKFSIYFNELLLDHINANEIIVMLNKQMQKSDIKIMIYEIFTKIEDGEMFEDIIENFEYFDPLFVTMYRMYLRSPDEIGSMKGYIDITYDKMQMAIARFVRIFVPCVYGFVALFVIVIYISIILPMMNVVGEI